MLGVVIGVLSGSQTRQHDSTTPDFATKPDSTETNGSVASAHALLPLRLKPY
ncbi:hypothetical protein BN8_01617 [Fibrisoma limi BUZ 3]|uniref:Uncharacterized protein n=1 Tax=Fibrisoma limi BUZ 3 TaxID=1185876 RepID=I2GFC9_9BACT|nr:hypothetical protein [Fibrisoma limi]CCH52604.1 hypothetical protein BN8_01617 [Fibrisoma limi BUZ 3]